MRHSSHMENPAHEEAGGICKGYTAQAATDLPRRRGSYQPTGRRSVVDLYDDHAGRPGRASRVSGHGQQSAALHAFNGPGRHSHLAGSGRVMRMSGSGSVRSVILTLDRSRDASALGNLPARLARPVTNGRTASPALARALPRSPAAAARDLPASGNIVRQHFAERARVHTGQVNVVSLAVERKADRFNVLCAAVQVVIQGYDCLLCHDSCPLSRRGVCLMAILAILPDSRPGRVRACPEGHRRDAGTGNRVALPDARFRLCTAAR